MKIARGYGRIGWRKKGGGGVCVSAPCPFLTTRTKRGDEMPFKPKWKAGQPAVELLRTVRHVSLLYG